MSAQVVAEAPAAFSTFRISCAKMIENNAFGAQESVGWHPYEGSSSYLLRVPVKRCG